MFFENNKQIGVSSVRLWLYRHSSERLQWGWCATTNPSFALSYSWCLQKSCIFVMIPKSADDTTEQTNLTDYLHNVESLIIWNRREVAHLSGLLITLQHLYSLYPILSNALFKIIERGPITFFKELNEWDGTKRLVKTWWRYGWYLTIWTPVTSHRYGWLTSRKWIVAYLTDHS